MDELIHLPEEKAVRRHLDAWNVWVLEHLMFLLAGVSALALLLFLGTERWMLLVPPVLNLLLLRGLSLLIERPTFDRFLRYAILGFVLVEYLLALSLTLFLGQGLVLWEYLVPIALLAFRLATVEYLLLTGGVLWAGALVRYLLFPQPLEELAQTQALIVFGIVTLIALVAGMSWTQRLRRRFVGEWAREVRQHRERTRMRQELEYARRIQLSMLPGSDPAVPGLELSSVSLPATEVGGDYYDYLRLPDGRLSIVVGDVAGHGVAAGLLISGVRSCLYLLRDSLPSPVEVMQRLNRMVKATTDRRLFITLLCAVVDRSAGRMVLASAGHLPPMHYIASTGGIVEHALPALPLGCIANARYSQAQVELASGDVLLFYSDGITELRDGRGDQFGDERLVRRFRTLASGGRGPRAIRDGILADLWNFKGDAEQADDVTLVVMKVN